MFSRLINSMKLFPILCNASSAAINFFLVLVEVIDFQPLNFGSQRLKERKSHSNH